MALGTPHEHGTWDLFLTASLAGHLQCLPFPVQTLQLGSGVPPLSSAPSEAGPLPGPPARFRGPHTSLHPWPGRLLLATAAGRPLLARTGTPGRFCHSTFLCADSAVGLCLLSVCVAYLRRASSRTPRPRYAVVSACWCSLVLSGSCVGDHAFRCPGSKRRLFVLLDCVPVPCQFSSHQALTCLLSAFTCSSFWTFPIPSLPS